MTGSRPHVAMIMPDLPVASDWQAAAEVHHDVTPLRLAPLSSPPTSPPAEGRDVARLTYRRLRPGRVFRRVNGAAQAAGLIRALRSLAASGRPVDLVHGHFASGSAGLPGMTAALGIPYVVSEHSSALTFSNPEKVISRGGLATAARVYGGAAAVLPVSESLEAAITQRRLSGAMTVVPNPVDTDRFAPGPTPSTPRITTVARLTTVKRLDLLVEAVARLADDRVLLDIAGAGPELDRLKTLAADRDLGDRVSFHGRLDRDGVAALLARSSVFAMSSHTENLPVAALEAMAAGLPLVAPAVGGLPDLLATTPGRLTEPGDVADLASGLASWLRPDDAARAAARGAAVAGYSINAVGDCLRDVYARALGRSLAEAVS